MNHLEHFAWAKLIEHDDGSEIFCVVCNKPFVRKDASKRNPDRSHFERHEHSRKHILHASSSSSLDASSRLKRPLSSSSSTDDAIPPPPSKKALSWSERQLMLEEERIVEMRKLREYKERKLQLEHERELRALALREAELHERQQQLALLTALLQNKNQE